jgi:hypothetical protein
MGKLVLKIHYSYTQLALVYYVITKSKQKHWNCILLSLLLGV